MKKAREVEVIRTNAKNKDFIHLVRLLDAELALRDGDEHSFYAQYNKIEQIKYAVILYHDGVALSCGALKVFEPKVMEVKRMFTIPEGRNKGCASKILTELENWARELGFEKCILETGLMQPEAIQLYKKMGYKTIANYGQYAGVANSICFEKKMNE
jgi:putative acetyltransferase